jgi:hypothetical protein
MNLIEQQSAAKDLPLQYLQQAVNGQNPNLTPWIATAELQRRTTMNQHMQKGPEGPMPTVKDQVEQKAGLMATQAAQQAQGAQMQQAAMPPGPVPEGTPTPEAQPEEPVMAAHGGLMNAPTNLHFAKGGILGFDGEEDGSYVDPASGVAIQRMPDQEQASVSAGILSLLRPSEPEWKKASRAQAKGERYIPPPGYDENGLPIKAAAPREVSAAARANDKAPRPSLQGQTIRDALPKAPPAPQGRRGPAVKPASATQTTTVDPMVKVATDFINSQGKTPTTEDAIAEQDRYDAKYGLDQPIGAEERDIIAQRNAARDDARKRNAKDAFAAYAAGTIGVPGSAGLSYSQARQAQDAAEREHLSTNLKDIKELNAAQRERNEKRATSAQGIGAADKLAAAKAIQEKASLAATMFNISSQAASDAARNLTSLEVARINQASAARPGETERIMATAIGLKATDPAKYATFMETLGAIRGAGKPDQGAAIADKAYDNVVATMGKNIMLQQKYANDPAAFQAAVTAETARLRGGAASGASTRLKFDAQGNQIK